MHCSKCGTESSSGRKYCAECGSPLSNRCPKCGVENRAQRSFARTAAAPWESARRSRLERPAEAHIAVADTPGPENIEGERKTVTALFADIKGSTELMEDLDPEEARAIVDPALKAYDRCGRTLRGLRRAIDRRRHLRAVRRAARP